MLQEPLVLQRDARVRREDRGAFQIAGAEGRALAVRRQHRDQALVAREGIDEAGPALRTRGRAPVRRGRPDHRRRLAALEPVVEPGRRGRGLPIAAPHISDGETAVRRRRHQEAGGLGLQRLGEGAHDRLGQLLAHAGEGAQRPVVRLALAQRAPLERAPDDLAQLGGIAGTRDDRERARSKQLHGGRALLLGGGHDHFGVRPHVLHGAH